jgi:hypothetical protein
LVDTFTGADSVMRGPHPFALKAAQSALLALTAEKEAAQTFVSPPPLIKLQSR